MDKKKRPCRIILLHSRFSLFIYNFFNYLFNLLIAQLSVKRYFITVQG